MSMFVFGENYLPSSVNCQTASHKLY